MAVGQHYPITVQSEWAISATGPVRTLTLADSSTDTTLPALRLNRNTTGTPAISLGVALDFGLETSTTESVLAGRITLDWRDVTHATRSAVWTIEALVGASMVNFLEIGGYSATVGSLVINQDGEDIDLRIEADTNIRLMVLDAGLFAGVGAVAFGGFVATTGFVQIVPPAFIAAANTDIAGLRVAPVGITVPAGTTAIAASVEIVEPVLTATGTITEAASLYVESAPTEGATANYALLVATGLTRLGGNLTLGTGEGGTVAPTGTTLRAPNVATGGAGNIAGADLTIYAGLGTGTGDEGTVIFGLPIVAAAGDNIQTIATRLTLDMAGSTTVLTMAAAQAMTISTAAGVLTLAPATTLQITPGTFATNITGAASTTNQTLTIENTSNAAAASHAIVDIAVGGTTSTGDPQLRLTIPGGTSWYMGVDNSSQDRLQIGTGTDVGTTSVFQLIQPSVDVYQGAWAAQLTPGARTFNGAAAAVVEGIQVADNTATFSNATQKTSLQTQIAADTLTLNQSAGATTVDKAAGISSISVTAGASVTLTHSSAFRALTGGAAVNVSGLYVEAQTAGTTASYGILLAASTTGDVTGLTTLKLSSLNGAITIAPSAGSLLFTGTLALTGSRVTQSYHTNITSTNAVTVDSSIVSKVPESIRDYINALDIIDDIRVVENRHRSELDPSGRLKLSVIAESINEPLILRDIDSPWGGTYPGVDLMGLAALHTRGIQELLARVEALEAENAALWARLATSPA